jgi:small subunit ribosomal protein S1
VEPNPEASSNLPVEAEPASEEVKRKAPIRIGTQRYGVKPPQAVPKPVLPQPSTSLLGKAKAHSTTEPAVEEEHRDEPREEASEAPTSEPVTPSAPAPREPRAKDQPRKPKRAPVPLAEPQPTRKYPPPNLRGQLSPDLELEYAEALGGQSLDDIIAGETGEVAAELEPQSRHRAKVVTVHRDLVFFEIAGRQQGVVPLRDFAEPPDTGAQFDVVVNRFVAAEGLYELSIPGAAVEVGDWSDVSEGLVVEARVTGHNKGGLECDVNRLRGFIPASQVSMYRVEDLEQFVGQTLRCVVTEANPDKRNLVLSHRAVLEREKAEAKETLLASLEPGQTREGTVRSLQNFGAFVDLGGVDGLIHISQLSWDRIKHAEEVLQLGQKVKVKILKIDPQTGKIALGFRDLSENPWETVARDFPVGTVVTGRVTRLTDFGAFVRLGPGVEGLIHISELAHRRVFRASDIVSEDQEVTVKILSVDVEAQRIGLSLKALEARAVAKEQPEEDEVAEETPPPPPPKKNQQPLKGGVGGGPTGAKFGLKW